MNQNTYSTITSSLFWGGIFLFFFELLTDFVESIYAFGLLGTSIPTEIVAVVFFLSPVLLLFFRKNVGDRFLKIAVILFVVSRMVEVFLGTRGKMLVSGFGVGSFLLFFPVYLNKHLSWAKAWGIAQGLLYAVLASMLLRAWGSGIEILTYGSWIWLGLLLCVLLLVWFFVRGFPPSESEYSVSETRKEFIMLRGFLFPLGIVGVLVVLYYAFIAPNVIVRWVGGNYPALLIGMVLSGSIIGGWVLRRYRLGKGIRAKVLLIWNIGFVFFLVFTIWLHQIQFPSEPGDFPLFEPIPAGWLWIFIAGLIITYPVIFVNFLVYVSSMENLKSKLSVTGIGFLIAGIYFLLAVFAHVFTTVYDYIPVVGPFFRNKFWMVHLLAGIVMALPLFVVRRINIHRLPGRKVLPAFGILLALVSIVGVLVTEARPSIDSSIQKTIKIMTYNIQQGYSEDGLRNYNGQLELIRQQNPDLLGLQESDTNRIANGNADVVRYFANQLGMYSYYGPKTVVGTFGIALLSRFPILEARTFYMYSLGEQTATIEARIERDGKDFWIYVTHLGNGGPIIQQQQVLEVASKHDTVVLMGDFNFRPDTPQYALTVSYFKDAWLLKEHLGMERGGVQPEKRIDHIFLTPEIKVLDAQYILSPVSDHPAMVVIIEG